MKLSERSLKSKEKFADGLMSVGNTIHSAAFIAVYIFPLTAFMSTTFIDNEPLSFSTLINHMSWQNVAIFGIVYLLPVAIGFYAKEKAMDLYDEVNKLTSNPPIKRDVLKRAPYVRR